MNASLKLFAKSAYPSSRTDLYAMFMERASRLSKKLGFSALITMHGWMFLSTFEELRKSVARSSKFESLIHIGARGFDSIGGEVVQTAAFVLGNRPPSGRASTFIRLVDGKSEAQKQELLSRAIEKRNGEITYSVTAEEMEQIPGAPFAYWVSSRFRRCFVNHGGLESLALFRQGMSTTDAARFEREWHEIEAHRFNTGRVEPILDNDPEAYWYPFNKGGARRRWFGNLSTVVRYERNGQDLLDLVTKKYPNISDPEFVIKNRNNFFLPSITYASIGTDSFIARSVPPGCAYSVAGPAIFPQDWDARSLLALLCSVTTTKFLEAINPTLGFQITDVGKIPFSLAFEGQIRQRAAPIADGCVALGKIDWDSFETSWNFSDQPLLRPYLKDATLETSWRNWETHCSTAIRRMQVLETENNRLFIEAYGLQDELSPEVPEEQITLARADARRDMAAFLSYALGCMMGRYSLDKPGLILADAGDSLSAYFEKLGKSIDQLTFAPDEDGIVPVLDGEWFEDDVVGRTREFLRATFGDVTLRDNIRFIEESLGKDLRKYFLTDFYKDHLQTYKKRPIYWMVQSPKKSFSVLIYLHRYTRDTMTAYFWREVGRAFGYTPTEPSLRDFVVSLFRAANPLDKSIALHPHAKVFLQRWKDSQAYSSSFRSWSGRMERELRIEVALGELDERTTLGDSDTFELFEKFSIHRLCQSFVKGAAAVDLRAIIQQRRTSFWLQEHKSGYAALEHAVELRELLASAELTIDSFESGFKRYAASWWRIDTAYRHCVLNLRRYGQVNVMQPISQWVDKAYVNNFLLPLTDRWSDQVRRLERWDFDGLPPQRRFHATYVQPFLSKGQKVFVIVSDALRYEAAKEFAQQLRSASRWTAEVDAVLGSVPSYTQLGMASLLPGSQLSVNATTANVDVDGRSAVGTTNRAEILRLASHSKATALQSEQFLELNTKTEGRALMRDHEVIYIFHNAIDKVGDAAATEAKTFDAVEQAFKELDLIIKKIANVNGSNMLLTSDHGFLFQQDHLDDGDMVEYPPAGEWKYRNRRFALGTAIVPSAAVKVFSSAALDLQGDWSVAFPLSLGRFPLQGSGKRFVHGGTSLQEVVVPVVKIHKARTDDTERVEVELLQVPAKITTGQVSISLLQDRPATGKVLARTLRIGIFAKDGTPLSEIKTLKFDSKEDEARLRETGVVLVLSHAADAFNNQEVDLRLLETVQGTTQSVTYRVQSLKLHKPFASDFDEF